MKGGNENALTFAVLIGSISHIHNELSAQASRAVNVSLTMRNWLIGFHIFEYEQNGADRASYGDKLLDRLTKALGKAGLKRMDVRELRRYRQFYLTYPQIRETLTPEMTVRLPLQQWPVWTTTFSFLNTSLSCRTKMRCNALSKSS